jgi:hypothetical protein
MTYRLSFLTAAVMLCNLQSAQAVSVLITVDNTGANVPVSTSAPRTWNFAIKEGSSITVGKALFGLNDGVNTTENITFSIWNGLGGDVSGNTVQTTISLGPAQVDGFFATLEEFAFTPMTLTPGNYSVTLTSNASDAANRSYFLKSGAVVLQLDDGSGTPLSSDYWVQDTNNEGTATTTLTTTEAIPEPTTATLTLLALLPLLRRKRG